MTLRGASACCNDRNRSVLSQERKNFRISFYSFIFFVFASILLAGCNKSKKGLAENYVILVSLDGFRWDYDRLYDTPNLDRLASDGVKADRMIPSFPVKTFPNHYSIATGLYPDHHGIINNSFFAPDLGLFYRMKDRSVVENPAFYGGEPVWVTAARSGIKSAAFYWVGSEAPVQGIYPSYWKKYEDNFDFMSRIDTVVKWLSYPLSHRPRLITFYFPEPDATSNFFGPRSSETEQIVEKVDSLIGILRERLNDVPLRKKINLIIVSDHGMGTISPERFINIKDIIPERMVARTTGSSPVYFIDPADGKKDSILLLVNAVKGVKAWSKDKIPGHLHFGSNSRIPEIVVIADSSWMIDTRPAPPVMKRGAHGYDISNSDMHAIFYAAGPSFKKNYRFEKLYNVDIYNLVCRLLDITPAANDGDPARIEGMLR
jgi:alkaline phosphatase D